VRRERISLPPYHNVNAAITWQVGMELLCALSGEAGNAIAYYRELTESSNLEIYACMGNQDTGKNEIAEEALVRKLIETTKERGLKTVSIESRIAPSGSTYLPPFYLDLGFAAESEGARLYKLDVAGAGGASTPVAPSASSSAGLSKAEVDAYIAKVKAEVDAVAKARTVAGAPDGAADDAAPASGAAAGTNGKPMGLNELLMKGIATKRLSSIFRL
jgi:hypothetical protein